MNKTGDGTEYHYGDAELIGIRKFLEEQRKAAEENTLPDSRPHPNPHKILEEKIKNLEARVTELENSKYE